SDPRGGQNAAVVGVQHIGVHLDLRVQRREFRASLFSSGSRESLDPDDRSLIVVNGLEQAAGCGSGFGDL
ncbi:hypothetical protein ABT116_50045, partial [Streptomyces sp. NPDC002130]|uniref:hypothetical protein n=1 Tax=Streptomyces sp. NPDC002130 TaxID=3155568 RepID=UPI00331A3595